MTPQDTARYAAQLYWSIEEDRRRIEKAEAELSKFITTYDVDMNEYVRLTQPRDTN